MARPTTLRIPDIWLQGYLLTHGCTVADAVAHWLEQDRLEAQFRAERGL
jgi:hypothetical protein